MSVEVAQSSYTLIDGKKISTDIKNEISEAVALRKKENKKIPHLAIILVGDDGASQTMLITKLRLVNR
jgi:methylenetetrahydrofolate dehydrogenase (NADP+) / methenyltetrahydrofolate cyclohydrolase